MERNHKSRTATLISFSGIDGAGKGTQIEALMARLQEAGLKVRLIPFWDEVACLKQLRESAGHKLFKGDKGVGRPEAPIERRDKNVQSWPMRKVRLGLYLLDTLSLCRVVRKAMRSGVDVVICDRYAYDELANMALDSGLERAYAGMILKIAPTPDVRFLLDANPAQARARKPEYPLEFLYRNRESYMRLSQMAGMTVVPPLSIDDVKQQVLEAASAKLGLPILRNMESVGAV